MTNSMMAAAAAMALALTGTVPVPALAVQAASDTPADSTKKLPDGTTPAERANTARLNAEQAAKAKADNITYQQEVSAAAQQVAHDQAEFVEDTAAYEIEKARIAALSTEERLKYEAAVAAWKADVAACKAGETHRCAKPKPTLPPQDPQD
ncbi:hypothetical protein K5P26_07570 [Sphingopyxis sp. XHP0097]|uniref:Cell wall hydrolase n=1 Tax=Sphingopyxis jiangsuensis TaxID=2871171 RepID=A0ABS7MEB3_9SPHN|nr:MULTISPECIES: hypothetical protein [Sphingopyxis]MBY4636994.1 hypothetical protein [Sphingopyxis jiangsuensis]